MSDAFDFVAEGCERNAVRSDTFLTTLDPIDIMRGAPRAVVERAGGRAGSVGVFVSL